MKKLQWRELLIIGLILLVLSGSTYGWFLFSNFKDMEVTMESEIRLLQNSVRVLREKFTSTTEVNSELVTELNQERGVSNNLSQDLQTEQAKNTMFESQIKEISGTVNTLQKLSQTDEELLSKYSKVYFLNENFIPQLLTRINAQYLLDNTATKQIHASVDPFLSAMMEAASKDGIDLKIVSAYRSFEDQAAVKTGYKVLYGSGANQFSADQGYSEHQLGTTLDFTTTKLRSLVTSFDKTDAYAWLSAHAYTYGFVLSYPKENVYYQYEPWHWRFVGVQLAKRLHDENKYFYDLAQRDINEYLITIFDR
jgi:D-alanyl-D-alanine carboxypeptidase